MIIFFRSCEANLSPGSLANDSANKPRWNGKYKSEILRKCYKSIQSGVESTDTIIIVNDRTTSDTLAWMQANTIAKVVVHDIPPLDETRKNHKYPTYHPIHPNSCVDLMELVVKICEDNPNELIYLCEDDYLHVPNALLAMKELFKTGYNGFYVPYDYPDRYTIDVSRICELHAGPFGHLRTVPSATLTFAAPAATLLFFKYELLRAGVFADDSWTWKAFRLTSCLAPVPGHSTHLQENCITPYIDWEVIYNSVEI